jgi:hypothetical protein
VAVLLCPGYEVHNYYESTFDKTKRLGKRMMLTTPKNVFLKDK